ADADVVVVAVKPGDVAATLETALPALGTDSLVVSIAAGVTIATLEALVPDRPVVRAMPNTPALVGAARPRLQVARTQAPNISISRSDCSARSASSFVSPSPRSTRSPDSRDLDWRMFSSLPKR